MTQKNSALSAPAGLNKLTCKSLAGAPTAQIEHQMVHQEQLKPPFCPRGGYYSFAMMRVSIVAPSGAEGGAAFWVNSLENLTISRHFMRLSPWDKNVPRRGTKIRSRRTFLGRVLPSFLSWCTWCTIRCTKNNFGAPINNLQVSRLRAIGALSAPIHARVRALERK